MKILFISTWFPYPHDNGARIRIYHLLQALAQQHPLTLVAFLPSPEDKQYLPELKSWCTQVEVIERDPFWRDPRKKIGGYFSTRPRDIIRSYSVEMSRLVDSLTTQNNFDIVLASTLFTAEYSLQINDIPRILEEQNYTTGWMEERYKAQRNPLRRASGWFTWQKCQRYERWLYPQFAAVTMVSDRDRQAVRKAIPRYTGRLEVIPNGVDLETRHPGLAEPVLDTLVFNGSLTYAANREAMRWFTGQIWSLIRQRRPQARLTITGRTEGVDLGWLPKDANIHLSGYLEDVRPAVAGSWLAVAPLLDGSGTRLKILEAMALGTPVVATSKGAEGLEVTPGQDILIADRAEAFAGECLRVLEDAQLRGRLAQNGRRLVEQRYGWDAIGRRFCELVEDVAAEALPQVGN